MNVTQFSINIKQVINPRQFVARARPLRLYGSLPLRVVAIDPVTVSGLTGKLRQQESAPS